MLLTVNMIAKSFNLLLPLIKLYPFLINSSYLYAYCFNRQIDGVCQALYHAHALLYTYSNPLSAYDDKSFNVTPGQSSLLFLYHDGWIRDRFGLRELFLCYDDKNRVYIYILLTFERQFIHNHSLEQYGGI
ncbi:hypothetical protein Dsin_027732 [Dipteronia sinensis]|uniref:Uncharacterized protein n=1 Tax=Dipteronia sinensis TaxID=43782 RepID=A0AAE0DTV3_9ROSI|nr:hypothetical protein Dsin_027732 [Dipteronia sinensis]